MIGMVVTAGDEACASTTKKEEKLVCGGISRIWDREVIVGLYLGLSLYIWLLAKRGWYVLPRPTLFKIKVIYTTLLPERTFQ